MSQSTSKLSRRFLFASATTVGAVAAVTSFLPATRGVAPAAEQLKAAPEKGGGYSLSEHVKQYYRTTRI